MHFRTEQSKRSVPGLLIVFILLLPNIAQAYGEEPKQPSTIYRLKHSIDLSFSKFLTEQEYFIYRSIPSEAVRKNDEELYRKISENTRRWIEQWMEFAAEELDKVPEKRLAEARAKAGRVNTALGEYFQARGWSYIPMKVVYIPQKLFHNEASIYVTTRGMYFTYYPSAFFVSLSPASAMEVVILHETLHFNRIRKVYGRPLDEGITEEATRYLILKLGLGSRKMLSKEEAYSTERERVGVIIKELVKRTGMERGEAIELLLACLITGNQEPIEAILGEKPWVEVIQLSWTEGGSNDRWFNHDIRKILAD